MKIYTLSEYAKLMYDTAIAVIANDTHWTFIEPDDKIFSKPRFSLAKDNKEVGTFIYETDSLQELKLKFPELFV